MVALAGPTGVGKSQLFNALAGTELAPVGRRRPTTAAGQAAVWGGDARALLDWLGIGRRHQVDADDLDGLVLLDLPDFDSVETAHRVEAERIVALADLVALGRRAAEVRRRVAARSLPAPARVTRRGDGRRSQPGRPARAGRGCRRGGRTWSACSPRTA